MTKTRKINFDTALAGKMNRVAAKETESYRKAIENTNYDILAKYNSFELLNGTEGVNTKQIIKFSTNFKNFINKRIFGDVCKEFTEGNFTKSTIKNVKEDDGINLFTIREFAIWMAKTLKFDSKNDTYKELRTLVMGRLDEEEEHPLVNLISTFLYGLAFICGEIQAIKQAMNVQLESVIAFIVVRYKNPPQNLLKYLVEFLNENETPKKAEKKDSKKEEKEEEDEEEKDIKGVEEETIAAF